MNVSSSNALLTEAQAADYLRLSPRTLQMWRVSGRGPIFTKLSRAVRYRRKDLDDYVRNGMSRSTTEADARKGAM